MARGTRGRSRDGRHGPRLDDVQAVLIAAPLDVHRPAVVRLDEAGQRDEPGETVVGELLGAPFVGRYRFAPIPSVLIANEPNLLLGYLFVDQLLGRAAVAWVS